MNDELFSVQLFSVVVALLGSGVIQGSIHAVYLACFCYPLLSVRLEVLRVCPQFEKLPIIIVGPVNWKIGFTSSSSFWVFGLEFTT